MAPGDFASVLKDEETFNPRASFTFLHLPAIILTLSLWVEDLRVRS